MKSVITLSVLYLISFCSLFVLMGCESGSSQGNSIVQGTVTIDGTLATRGTITFYPKKDGPVAVGQIHKDGSYVLRTGLGNINDPDATKINSGDYVATVMIMGDPVEGEAVAEGGPPLAGPRLIAKKYIDKETSGLVFEVKPGRNLFVLNLEGSESDPPLQQLDESSSESENAESPGTADLSEDSDLSDPTGQPQIDSAGSDTSVYEGLSEETKSP